MSMRGRRTTIAGVSLLGLLVLAYWPRLLSVVLALVALMLILEGVKMLENKSKTGLLLLLASVLLALVAGGLW